MNTDAGKVSQAIFRRRIPAVELLALSE